MNKLTFNQKKLQDTCKTNNVAFLGIFGSYSRGEETKKSDLDLLVDFTTSKSYFELIDVESEFSKIFGKKIDLVTRGALNKYIRPYVYSDLKTLYNVDTG